MAHTDKPMDMRERIFRAALEVCAEKGYHATRMEDIVERSQTSKGAIYHHFESKRDLFLQLYDAVMLRTMAELTPVEPGASAEELLREVMRVSVQWLGDEALVRGMIEFYVLGLRDDEVRERFAASYRMLLELGASIVRHGIERGELDESLDPEAVVGALFPAADGLVFMYLSLGTFDRLIGALELYTDLMIRSLRKPAPPAPGPAKPPGAKKTSSRRLLRPAGVGSRRA